MSLQQTIVPNEELGDLAKLGESLYSILNRFKKSEDIDINFSSKDYLNIPLIIKLRKSGINLLFKHDKLVLIQITKFDSIAYNYNGVDLKNLMGGLNLKVIYNKIFGPTYPGKIINDDVYMLGYPGISFKINLSGLTESQRMHLDKNKELNDKLSYLLNLSHNLPCDEILIYKSKEYSNVVKQLASTDVPEIKDSSTNHKNSSKDNVQFKLNINKSLGLIKFNLADKGDLLIKIGETNQQDILNFLGPPDDYFNKFDSRLLIHKKFLQLNNIYKFHNYFKFGIDFLYDLNNNGQLVKVILHNGNIVDDLNFSHWNKCNYQIYLGEDSNELDPFMLSDSSFNSSCYFSQIPEEFFDREKTPILLNRLESEYNHDLNILPLNEFNSEWGQSRLFCSKNLIWEVLDNDCISCITFY